MNEFNEYERNQIWIERLKKEFKNSKDEHELISSIAQMLTLRDKKIDELLKVHICVIQEEFKK